MIQEASIQDYPRLLDIWISAVKATHDFLLPEDFEYYKSQLVSSYFPSVKLFICKIDGIITGFAGIYENKIEMLFVHNDYRGRGMGKELLQYLVNRFGVNEVEVNEQNLQAIGFYKSFGFITKKRSDFDSAGRPYPLITMVLKDR